MEPLQESVISDIQERYFLQPVSNGKRFANFIIDLIFLYLLDSAVGYAIGMLIVISDPDNAYALVNGSSFKIISILISIVVGILYYTVVESATKGRTIGKLITKTVAVKADSGAPITFKDAFIRSICRYIPFEPFSALNGFPWHDTMSKTVVIDKR